MNESADSHQGLTAAPGLHIPQALLTHYSLLTKWRAKRLFILLSGQTVLISWFKKLSGPLSHLIIKIIKTSGLCLGIQTYHCLLSLNRMQFLFVGAIRTCL